MLQRDVHLPAGTDEVWTAITDPVTLEEWFGASVEWDLRPGGLAEFRQADGDREGRVDGVEPGRHLRFRWWPVGAREDVSEVTYELRPEEDGTLLTVTERRVAASPAPPAPDTAGGAAGDTAGDAAGVSEGPSARAADKDRDLVPVGPVDPADRWGPDDQAMLHIWASCRSVAVG